MDAEPTAQPTGDGASSPEVNLPLPADVRSPGRARAFVRDRWPDTDQGVLDDVTLIVSELVSNAVQHGEPDIVLRMRVDPLSIDVSVLDHGSEVPEQQIASPDVGATSGRGLSIVDRLASDWGVEPLRDGSGKSVWARLQVDS